MCKCKTKYCRREAARNGLCYPCERKRTIEANPYRYWLQVNKDNAKRRGKYWNISLSYWIRFCDETGYLALKGRGRDDATVDCKINELGYIDGNLQLLTRSENSKKGTKRAQWDWVNKCWVLVQYPTIDNTDNPF